MSKCSDCIHADVVGWEENEMIDVCRLGNDITLFWCEDYESENEDNDE